MTEEGPYQVETIVQGKGPDGTIFLRTTEQFIEAVKSDITLTGTATAQLANDFYNFQIGVVTTDAPSTSYVAFAQVNISKFPFSSNSQHFFVLFFFN